MNLGIPSAVILGAIALLPIRLASDDRVTFSAPTSLEVYDFVEITVRVKNPRTTNPFTDASVKGSFRRQGGQELSVEGFCDFQDGTIYRIRFMPVSAGQHSYTITYQDALGTGTSSGLFEAKPARRRGIVRVDKDYPFHFVWEGTGEHYFWNSTTTYSLAGWDEETIRCLGEGCHRSTKNMDTKTTTRKLGAGDSKRPPGRPIRGDASPGK